MVITTAAVPGKKAPLLVTKDMVHAMAAGSVIVDLAAERGGNCEVTRRRRNGDRTGRFGDGADERARHGSAPRQPNVRAQYRDVFEKHDDKEGQLNIDLNDEITRDTLVARGGRSGESRRCRRSASE